MKIFLETTIKGQSFQVVLDNEAFFSCQTNGFLHRSSFYRKTEKQKPTFNLQIDISLSLAFLLIIQKVNKRKRSVNVRFYRRSRLQSKKAHHRLHCGKYPSAKREICAQYSALKSEFSKARAVKFKEFKKNRQHEAKKISPAALTILR